MKRGARESVSYKLCGEKWLVLIKEREDRILGTSTP